MVSCSGTVAQDGVTLNARAEVVEWVCRHPVAINPRAQSRAKKIARRGTSAITYGALNPLAANSVRASLPVKNASNSSASTGDFDACMTAPE